MSKTVPKGPSVISGKIGGGGFFLFFLKFYFHFSFFKQFLLTVTNTSLQHQAFSPATQSLTKGATTGPQCLWSNHCTVFF